MDYTSRAYWDRHHEAESAREQTKALADALVPRIRYLTDYITIVDYGCGSGGMMPALRARWPHASLVGVDFSPEAIEQARTRYPWAAFICGGHESVPKAELILASNILEHLENEMEVVSSLLAKCHWLLVAVPYREHLCRDPFPGHVNFYELDHYAAFPVKRAEVFASRGWSEHGLQLVRRVWLRNALAWMTGRRPIQRRKQILYTLRGARP